MTLAQQRSIFDQPMARATDPDTSHMAARDAATTAETNRAWALRLLRQHPEGLSDFDLEDLTGVQQTSIGKRRGELVKMGLVENSGRKTFSPSGSRVIVWRAVQDRNQPPASRQVGCPAPAPTLPPHGASGRVPLTGGAS